MISIEIDGVVEHHIEPVDSSAYATICGLDGNDGDQFTVDTPKGAKINCDSCVAIWQACKGTPKRMIEL